MKLFVLLIYFLTTVLLSLSIFIISKGDWLKTDLRFIAKKLLDFLIYGVIFIFTVSTNYIMIYYKLSLNERIVPFIICISLSIYSVFLFTQQIAYFRTHAIERNKRICLLILVSLLFGILISMSTINYSIYMICPQFYKIQENLSFVGIAFEFIYYSFTLAITYSSSSISVIHIITKLVQMAEIIYFYVIFGSIIINIISNIDGKDKK